MKDYLLNLVSPISDKPTKVNIMREYLQVYALRTMFEKGRFGHMAFVGGTTLRFIHALPRFSEDLDFSLTSSAGYNFEDILYETKQAFVDANYKIAVKYDCSRTVHSAFLKFPELLHAAGLSHRKEQNLSIKIDVDTRPPTGAVLARSLVNKYFPITFTHYDLPSLFAGKLCAILTRPYVKGRDYFDLAWILSRWRDINPNIDLLNAALKQAGRNGDSTAGNWKARVLKKISAVEWNAIVIDVEKFLENPNDLNILTLENVKALLM